VDRAGRRGRGRLRRPAQERATRRADAVGRAYANDVVGYIPSARVLKEGGYEAEYSQYYYGHPGPWSPNVEDTIVTEARRLVKAVMPEAAPGEKP
jgi:hypothetical protein